MDVSQPVGIGTDFLGYRIEELLGRGGMGVVYRAYDLRLKRPVALKLVAPALARDDRFRERFARESELVMSLEHPNVVPIYDAGDVDGLVYLAMRLVDGRDLGSLLRVEGALEPARAIRICSQIAAALDAAHARGLVHRDVKPSNVLLDSSDHVYLADFGLTRRLDDEEGAAGEDATVGTPAYLAPEQLDGGPVGEPADVYALGCVLYECLTGEPVFVRSSRLAVAWAHLEEEPPKPSRLRTELPEAVDAVVARALAKEPERRYPSCGALVAAAGAALGLQARSTSRRRRLLLAGAAALAVAASAVVGATTFAHGGSKSAAPPLLAGPNTLARIDPATSTVSRVFRVGDDPVVAAGADYTVWVFSRGSETITQVNAVTNRIVETTPVSRPAECCSLFTGPVLAADPSGAWFVEGGVAGKRALLVHIPVGRAGKRVYPLPLVPTGVAVSGTGDSVWVVGHHSRHDEVLRIDPFTGAVTGTLRRRRSTGIDSIAFGYGRVWVLSSGRARLYRINPRSVHVTGRLVLPHTRAMRPEIMSRGGDIWVREADGTTSWIHPSPLAVYNSDDSTGQGEDRGQLGSLWWYDSATGRLSRQQVANGPIRTISVTRPTRGGRGPCLTSIAIVPPSIWMAVAPSVHSSCER